MSSNSNTGSPCGACKFLRRKCASDCVFAPYFSNEHGSSRFAAIHKVFGASNAAKLLLHVPQHERCEAVVTIAYEAQARVRDPVYGCVSHIFALQQQVASLQAQLMQAKAQLARGTATSSGSVEEQCRGNIHDPFLQYYNAYAQSMSPQSSLDGVENNFDYLSMQTWNKRMALSNESGELHDLVSRMMRN